jgi:hypothetical protein
MSNVAQTREMGGMYIRGVIPTSVEESCSYVNSFDRMNLLNLISVPAYSIHIMNMISTIATSSPSRARLLPWSVSHRPIKVKDYWFRFVQAQAEDSVGILIARTDIAWTTRSHQNSNKFPRPSSGL